MEETTITKLALCELIKDAEWSIAYHEKKLLEAKQLKEIYINQLNQMN